jgi:hypothetical protein
MTQLSFTWSPQSQDEIPGDNRKNRILTLETQSKIAIITLFCDSMIDEQGFAVQDALVGVWSLISAEYRDQGGDAVIPYLGPRPQGTLIYATEGIMSVQVMSKVYQPVPVYIGGMLRGTPIASCMPRYPAWRIVGSHVNEKRYVHCAKG